jgi:enoyl-CoA hydratase
MTTTAHIEFTGNIATLTLANAEVHKPATLDEPTLDAIAARLREFDAWRTTSMVTATPLLVVRSTHERYFVVGADVNALERLNATSIASWVALGHHVFHALEAVQAPTVALVEGFALGGGLELAMACDFIWATPTAQFGQPEATLGLPPGWGATLRLPRRVGAARAKEMLFSARLVDAQTALAWGLVERVGERAELQEWLDRFAAEIAGCSASAIAETKRLVHAGYAEAVDRSLAAEAAASARCIAGPDACERIANFLNRRRG